MALSETLFDRTTLLKTLGEIARERECFPLLTGDQILAAAMAHPDSFFYFRYPGRLAEKDLLWGLEPPEEIRKATIFATESPFCTADAWDLIWESVEIKYGEEVMPEDGEEKYRVEIIGASFPKPTRRNATADFIARVGSAIIVADGASMVASPTNDSEFPQQIKERVTIEGEFMPDVLWTTMLSRLLGRTFYSPFASDVDRIFNQSFQLREIAEGIPGLSSHPDWMIELVNKGMKIFLGEYFGMEVKEENKVYLPSGVMGVVDLRTWRWASTGDVRIGVTYNCEGDVMILNNWKKVDNYDSAVYGWDQSGKTRFAQARAKIIGNIQGLPIQIERGEINATKPKSTFGATTGLGAIVLWTDGEEIRNDGWGDWMELIGCDRNSHTSFTGTLLVRDPFLAHLYLLYMQKRYIRETERRREKSGNRSLWRPDDAAFIVAYLPEELCHFMINNGHRIRNFF